MSHPERVNPWNNIVGSFATSQGDARLQRGFMLLYAREFPEGFKSILEAYDAYTDEAGQERIDDQLRPFYDSPQHPQKIIKPASYRQQSTRVLQDALYAANYSTGVESEDRLRVQCGALMLWKDAKFLLKEGGRNRPPSNVYNINRSSYVSQSLHYMFVEGENAHFENSINRTVARAANVFRMAIEKYGQEMVQSCVLEEPKWQEPIRMTPRAWRYSTQAYGIHLQHYPEHADLVSNAFLDQVPPASLEPPFVANMKDL